MGRPPTLLESVGGKRPDLQPDSDLGQIGHDALQHSLEFRSRVVVEDDHKFQRLTARILQNAVVIVVLPAGLREELPGRGYVPPRVTALRIMGPRLSNRARSFRPEEAAEDVTGVPLAVHRQ